MSVIRVLKKFGSLLSTHQKLRVFELAILMVIGGFVEMCSVTLVLPFMSTIVNPELAMDKWYAKLICRTLMITSSKNYMVILAVSLALVYISKNAYLLLEMDIQYRFVYGNMFVMQKRLLANIMRRPYKYFLTIDSGEIIRLVNSDTPATFNLLATVLGLFSELIVSIVLIATIFVITPDTTLFIASVMMVMLAAINFLIKPKMKKISSENMAAMAGMNKWLLQSLQGIKEIKVMKREAYFQEHYDMYGGAYVDTTRKSQILGLVPRFFIEAASMGTMFLIIALLIYKDNNLEGIIPMISAVMMAALRLLPSINRISFSLAQISYNEGRLDKLLENLKQLEDGKDNLQKTYDNTLRISFFDKFIGMESVSFQYDGAQEKVLNEASLVINKGEYVGLIGSSGAGKSTIVDLILGLLHPKSGRVAVDGKDIYQDLEGWLGCTGYIPQSIFLLDDSIRANVLFGNKSDAADDEKIWDALRGASLENFVKSLPDGLDTQIGERGVRLSGGQKQRIGIARALYQNPAVLFFDEATSALDNETEKEIMESINHLRGSMTMIIIAHRLTTIANCDSVYRVENGKIHRVKAVEKS